MAQDAEGEPSPPIRLASDGATPDQLARLRALVRQRIADDPAAPLVMVTTDLSPLRLASLLDSPPRGVIEWTDAGQLDAMLAELLTQADHPGLFLCLTTRAAFRCDIARLVGATLARILGLPDDRALSLRLALTEAVANAIIHGNLQLESSLRADPERFIEFSQMLSDRLDEPDRGLRPLAVDCHWDGPLLDVTVLDSGDGYPIAPAPAAAATLEAPSGRGLLLMRSLARTVRVSKGGRKVDLHFDR